MSPLEAGNVSVLAPANPFPALRQELDGILDAHIPRGAPVALLMFPYDGNVGNHMMWIAICDYLRERGIRVGYVAHGNNFRVRDMARAIGRGPVLFSGGVTISRLWPRHAQIKREVAAAFPHNPLISLPSTIIFIDRDDRDHAGGIFGSHRNVTVLARDPVSCANAREAFPDTVRVLTAPDLAFRLPTQPIRGQPVRDILWIARDDIEGVIGSPPSDVHVFDWPHDLSKHIPRAYITMRGSGILSRLRLSSAGRVVGPYIDASLASLYRLASHSVLSYGNHYLDTGRVLVTDRLHPHVLTALRRQPVVLLPDKFGKNRAVYDHFTSNHPLVKWASSPAEALRLARQLAG